MNIVNEEQANHALRLLAVTDKRRRQTLHILQHAGEPLSLADLTIELVRRETGNETIGTKWERVEQMQVALYHSDVPTLAEAGLVEFNTDRRTVTLRDAGAELIPLFDRMP